MEMKYISRRQRLPNSLAAFDEAGQVVQGNHIGAVAEGFVGARMGFEEDAVAAARHRRLRQIRDHAPLTAGSIAQGRWLLYAVGGVKDHRATEFLHHRNGPHVVDELAVAERAAALREQQVAIAGLGHFTDHVFHVPGRHELAFFHVDRSPGARGSEQQIGLPGEKRGNLQEIDDLPRCLRLTTLMDICRHRQPRAAFDRFQRLEPFVQPRPAEGFGRSAIRLVERRLEDERNLQTLSYFREAIRDPERQIMRLDDARPGDPEQRLAWAAGEIADGDGPCHGWSSLPARACDSQTRCYRSSVFEARSTIASSGLIGYSES
jgi:hypothetical protein